MSKPLIFNKNTKIELFRNPQAFKAILTFLDATKIGIKPLYKEEKEQNRVNLNSWNLNSSSNGSNSEEESESEIKTEIKEVK